MNLNSASKSSVDSPGDWKRSNGIRMPRIKIGVMIFFIESFTSYETGINYMNFNIAIANIQVCHRIHPSLSPVFTRIEGKSAHKLSRL